MRKAGLAFVAVVSLFGLAPAARAAGIRVTPVENQLAVSSAQKEASYEIAYVNTGDQPQEIAIHAVDFGALDESGGIAFLGSDSQRTNDAHSLVPWLELGSSSLIVPPHGRQLLTVRVINKDSLQPGGHYAAILATSQSDAAKEENQVKFNPTVASLLFLAKTGGETYRLDVQTLDTDAGLAKLPETVSIRWYNGGNVHVVPRGYVEVTDPLGRVVKRGIVNDASAVVMPETSRTLPVKLYDVARPLLPGRYAATVHYRYDGSDTFATVETARFIVPPQSLAAAGTLLALAAALAYVLVKIYRKIRTARKRA